MRNNHSKIRIALHGACGRMCREIAVKLTCDERFEIAFGVDERLPEEPFRFDVFKDFSRVPPCDVVVDFSFHTATQNAVEYALKNRIPIVVATTGHSDAERQAIYSASEQIPVFFAGNVSIGVYLATLLAKTAATFLDDNFDVEIIEAHHRAKADFPSGTAIALANAIIDAKCEKGKSYALAVNTSNPRAEKQVRVHSLRGGTMVGKHQVVFMGDGETITITHETESKSVFVHGVLKAIEFIVRQNAGLYGMSDLLSQSPLTNPPKNHQ